MSNLWFNLRIFSWHIQIGNPKWWKVRISFNKYHTKDNGWPDGYFGWYIKRF